MLEVPQIPEEYFEIQFRHYIGDVAGQEPTSYHVASPNLPLVSQYSWCRGRCWSVDMINNPRSILRANFERTNPLYLANPIPAVPLGLLNIAILETTKFTVVL
jgi:hypothetical protein